jgi:hypothetical protein
MEPTEETNTITEDGTSFGQGKGVELLRRNRDSAQLEIGSGTYLFTAELPRQ